MADDKTTIVYQGRHLSMRNRNGWEYAVRNTNKPAVGIVAITDAGEVVLVEQLRPPVGEKVIELPAGLTGDLPGHEGEMLLKAAQRELLEETGYTAEHWTELVSGYSSPGLTDESITLFLAQGLKRTGPGGGDQTEDIQIHEVPLADVLTWLKQRGAMADLKLLGGLFAASEFLHRNASGRSGSAT